MGIPLIALATRQPEFRDYNQNQELAQQIQGMKNQNALAPGQQQLQQQQIQGGQQELQIRAQQMKMQQQQMADQQAAQQIISKHGGNVDDALPELQKALSFPAFQAAVKANDEHKKSAAEAKKDVLDTEKFNTDRLVQLGQTALGMSDQDYLQNWPNIAASANAINPSLKFDPNTPIQKQQLQGSFLGLQVQKNYFDQETNRRANEEAERKKAEFLAKKDAGLLAGEPTEPSMAYLAAGDSDQAEQNKQGLKNLVEAKKASRPITNILPGGGAAASMVDMVGQNKIDLATVTSRMPPAAKADFIKQLAEKYPDYNQGNFGNEKAVQRAFTSGQYSQQLNSINRAREHMSTFLELAKANDTGDVKALNKVSNYFKTQFGSSAPGNLQIAKQAFASEVGKSFAGSNVALADRQELDHSVDISSSWGQLRDAAKTADSLLEGAQKALKQTYEAGKSGRPNFGEEQNTSPVADIPSNVSKALSGVGVGRHKLSDGSVWDKTADGTIRKAD